MVETLGRVHLVTEWVRGGELYNRITQAGPLKESHAAPLYKQLLLAVKHMVNIFPKPLPLFCMDKSNYPRSSLQSVIVTQTLHFPKSISIRKLCLKLKKF